MDIRRKQTSKVDLAGPLIQYVKLKLNGVGMMKRRNH